MYVTLQNVRLASGTHAFSAACSYEAARCSRRTDFKVEVTMNFFAKALLLLCIWDYRRHNRKKRA